MTWEAHSLYVATIYKFGVIGVIAFIALVVWAWKLLRDRADKRIYFINIGLWIIFLIAGISYTTAESTQYTWLLAFFMGVANNGQLKEPIERENV